MLTLNWTILRTNGAAELLTVAARLAEQNRNFQQQLFCDHMDHPIAGIGLLQQAIIVAIRNVGTTPAPMWNFEREAVQNEWTTLCSDSPQCHHDRNMVNTNKMW